MANEHKWYYEEQGELIGPIDGARMPEMIKSGELTGATPVWRDGLIGRQPINTIPELAGYLPDPSAPTSQAGVQPVAVTHVHSGAPTSGMAVASLVLGIISLALFCLVPISLPCGIIGLILGLSANKGPYKQPLATAGIVTSLVGCLIAALLIAGVVADKGKGPDQDRFDDFFKQWDGEGEADGEGERDGEGEAEGEGEVEGVDEGDGVDEEQPPGDGP